MVTAALLFGIVGTTWQAIRATDAWDDAVKAQIEEAAQRVLAEKARTAAEDARRQEQAQREEAERHRLRAEANFALARSAVDKFLNQVTENELLTVPGMQPLRQQLLSSAMEFYNEFAKDEVNSSELLMELATAHYRMAIIRHELGQTKTAAASVKKSIELFEQIRDAGDNSLDVQLGLARAYIESGRFKDALVSCRRILQTDANHAETRWMLSDAYHMLGGQLAVRRTYSEVNVALVLKYFQNSLEIREKMVEEFPDTPKYLAGLGATVNNLGVLLDGQGRPREALPMFERAAQCLAEAYRRNPRAMGRGHFLGLCLKNVAETQADLGNRRDALQSMQQLVEVRRKLVFENPAVTYLKGHLYKAHLDLGDLQMALGDATSANLSFRTAQDVMENFPRNTAGELFELATVYGALATPEYGASDQTDADRDDRQRYADLAMETIAAAVEKGWQDVGAIEHHTHLAPVRERDEFKQLVDRLRKELEAARLATAGGESDQQQLANRQQAADVLRELAGGEMPARQHRLTLATTLHSIGQIQIGLEHYDQAERSLQEALQIWQELLKESLDNPELQLDTLITRTAIGQLWWNTDRVHQSHPLWQDVLVQLHELAASQPDDPAFQHRVATLEREICHRYAELGLWDLAATVARHNAALKRITNDEYDIDLAVMLAATGEEDAWREYCQTVMDEIEANSTGSPPVTQIARTFCLLEPPALDVERCITLASEFLIGLPANQREWPEVCAALAYYRGSRFDEAWNLLKSNRITNCMDFDTGNVTHLPGGYLYALVAHANGRKDHAVAKLEQVEGLYRIACRNALATKQTKLCPGFLKFPWEVAAAQILRREAWRKIHDQAAPADGWWHLVRARSYWRIGDKAKAEIELAATETLTAEDSELYLARAWLFGHFGMATRAEAELTRMVEVGGVDPMPWIHRGRWYAERGELAKADADYAKAAVRTPDELNKFLEAGWWVVGPYPPELDEFCPPEVDPDPSKPVHTIDPQSGLSGKPGAWQPIPADNTGRINRTYFPGRKDPTSQYYALAHVYSPDERCMLLRRERGGPSKKMKLWVNGVQVATVTNEWWQKRIPIVLRRGRNELLIKGPATACVLRLGDNLLDRAQTFHEQGRWFEAATELCALSNTPTLVRSASKELLGRLLPSVACSKDQETYNALSMIVLRHPRPHLFTLFGAYTFPSPYSKLDADESIAIADESVLQMPRNFGAKRDAAVINYRIGRFDAARAYLDKIPTGDPELDPGLPLQALLCWHQDDQASARRWLSLAMNRFNALTGTDGQMLSARLRGGFDWAWEVSTFCVLLCEAHRDITGSDADIHDRLQAFAKSQRDFWLNQDPDIALFDHAVFTENHDYQRVYLARETSSLFGPFRRSRDRFQHGRRTLARQVPAAA